MNTGLLSFLPKPGQTIQIPGGVIFCESWEVNKPPYGEINGEIRFRFLVSAEEYEAAMKKQGTLPPVHKLLPAPPKQIQAGD